MDKGKFVTGIKELAVIIFKNLKIEIMVLNVIGLILDLIGVILLYRYGILPDNLWQHLIMDNGMSEKDERKHKRWSKTAMIFLILGFVFQLSGTAMQQFQVNNESTFFKQKAILKNLSNDKNMSTGAIGKLKLKYEDNRLFYQLEVKIELEKLDSIDQVIISFRDKQDFEVSDLKLSMIEFSNLITDKMISLKANNSINYPKGNFDKISYWELTFHKK